MPLQRSIGIAFWCFAVVGIGWATLRSERSESVERDQTRSLVHYWTHFGQNVTLDRSDNGDLPVGISVFHAPSFHEGQISGQPSGDDRGPRLIGHVASCEPQSLTIHLADPPAGPLEYTLYQNRGTMSETLALMMPPDTRRAIERRIQDAIEAHGREIAGQVVPIIGRAISQSLPLVEQEMRASIARHQSEVDALAEKWKRDVVQERLVPMARVEVLPVVRKHAEPTARQIGRELWDRASIWRFTWRALYDKSPLPEQGMVAEEWDRFVEEEAIPVFESRMDEIASVVQAIILETASNPNVRAELADAASQITSDHQTRQLVQTILRESVAENRSVRAVWAQAIDSDQARMAFDSIGHRIEPVVRAIGDELLGTPQTGISPGFARVLRNQVLGRDRQWIVAVPTSTASGRLRIANDSQPYPIIHLADEPR